MKIANISPDLFCIRDDCNIYLLRSGNEAIAIDFGSGKWMSQLPSLGIRRLSHVFLTHHHADQCKGLLKRKKWPFQIHAPKGEQNFLSPRGVHDFYKNTRGKWPLSYSVLPKGIPNVHYDMNPFGDFFWKEKRLRFVPTPGHGQGALTIVANLGERQVLFCGDAAHAGATIWQPYHLEWDHWTGTGALAAWEGVIRIASLGVDVLCPSHGPIIKKKPRVMLRSLAAKLLKFYRAKGQIAAGERDRYGTQQFLASGARRILPHLFQFSGNNYLLLSTSGEAMVIDACQSHPDRLTPLLRELGNPRITAATISHYHSDHSEGIPRLKQQHRAKIWLHPWVALPLRRPQWYRHPWLPKAFIRADALLPERGQWQWNEYTFDIAPFPGQTWWHCAFVTSVDDSRVLFGGDNFQPPSRWNGTGGFSSVNGSRFEGFIQSAKQVIQWKPDLLACGHGTYYHYRKSYFLKVIAWAKRAEIATRALCPSGKLDIDYYLHSAGRQRASPKR